jgi:hypothetical protein
MKVSVKKWLFKRRPFLRTALLAGGAAWIVSGCTSSSFVRYRNEKPIDPKTDGQYRVTGYVHSRDWTTCLFVAVPVGINIDEKSAAIVNRPGDSEIGPVALHTENYTINPAILWAHYGGFFPYIIGTRCNYVSATYVTPTTTASGSNHTN